MLIFFSATYSGHNYIGSEHLLLGLLREGQGVAARVLEILGADPNNIRTQAIIIFCSCLWSTLSKSKLCRQSYLT